MKAPFGFACVAGDAGDEWTMRENLAAFNRWVLNPNALSGHRYVDATTRPLGTKLSYPVITAPMGITMVMQLADTPDIQGITRHCVDHAPGGFEEPPLMRLVRESPEAIAFGESCPVAHP